MAILIMLHYKCWYVGWQRQTWAGFQAARSGATHDVAMAAQSLAQAVGMDSCSRARTLALKPHWASSCWHCTTSSSLKWLNLTSKTANLQLQQLRYHPGEQTSLIWNDTNTLIAKKLPGIYLLHIHTRTKLNHSSQEQTDVTWYENVQIRNQMVVLKQHEQNIPGKLLKSNSSYKRNSIAGLLHPVLVKFKLWVNFTLL